MLCLSVEHSDFSTETYNNVVQMWWDL